MARIAVIGAGMGALAAAARLAAGGHRVVVYERSATHGGGVGWYERDGFGFDTGPGLLHLPAVYRDLFIKTGARGDRRTLEQSVELVPVDPSARHVFADGTAVSLPDASRGGVVAALDEAFGAGAGERWGELLTRARVAWEATRRPLLEEVMAAGTPPPRDPYPARPVRRGLLRRGAPTLAEVAARELRDPRLAALLEHYAWAYGLDPRTAPASATVLPYMEQTFGTWYVRGGGLRALADAVHDRCAARGVEFRFGSEVVRVLEKDGCAAGVELADGTLAEADTVVSGAASGRPAGGLSRFTVLLALRGARPADAVHRTVVHGDEPITVLRPDDPALCPDDGHEAVTLTVTVPPLGGPVDWADEAVAREYADRVVAAAGAAVPGLAERALWRVVRTPADIERETGAPGGVVTAPALAGAGGACLREPNRGALTGLYHVGGHAHPGGGPAHTGMSGAIVADLISGGPGGSR